MARHLRSPDASASTSNPRGLPYTGNTRAPAAHYDVVVIGAGIGGLTAANLLAKAGLSVLLVEQHYMVGGYCSTFRRRGFVFDAATHFYPLLGNPETITGRLLRDLGSTTEWVKMDPVDRFHLPDGTTFSVAADLDTYLADLKGLFPEEAGALDAFFAEVRRVYYLGLLHYFKDRATPQLAAVRDLTLGEVLERRFRDRKLKLLLAADSPHWGSRPENTSFVFDSMLRLSYFLGNYYPEGGSQVFADDLAKRFEARGGHVMTRTLAVKVLTRGGRARAVELESGPPKDRRRHVVRAGRVIANGDMLRLCEEMLDPGVVDPAFVDELRSLRPTMPCFLSHIGLKDVSRELLEDVSGYYWDSWNSNELGRDGLRFKIFSPTLYEPRMAPPGSQIAIIQRVREIDYDGVLDWAAQKEAFESHVLLNLGRLIPDLRDRIVVMTSASAATSYRYTLNSRGAMLGWEMSPDQLGAGRPEVESPVENLLFVGHWTKPGGGITPVIVSAMRAAELVTSGR